MSLLQFGFAKTKKRAANEPAATGGSSLTPEQRARIAAKRAEALAKRRRVGGTDLAAQLRDASWRTALADEFGKDYFVQLCVFLAHECASQRVYPPLPDVFAALNAMPLDAVRVVILGQDPYHGPSQATGHCFAVRDGVALPPSLRNIFQELESDIAGFRAPRSGVLSGWAQQGVLLLNTALTVRGGSAGSHSTRWHPFTDAVLRAVVAHGRPGIVFVLWGKHAQSKESIVRHARKSLVLKSPHPSPLSAHRGFFGSKFASKTNDFLRNAGREPIDWTRTKAIAVDTAADKQVDENRDAAFAGVEREPETLEQVGLEPEQQPAAEPKPSEARPKTEASAANDAADAADHATAPQRDADE